MPTLLSRFHCRGHAAYRRAAPQLRHVSPNTTRFMDPRAGFGGDLYAAGVESSSNQVVMSEESVRTNSDPSHNDSRSMATISMSRIEGTFRLSRLASC